MDRKEVCSAVSKLQNNFEVRKMDIHIKALQHGMMIGCNKECKENGCSLDKPKMIDYLRLMSNKP